MYREVALVPTEHLQRAKEEYAKAAFTEVHAIPYGEFHLLSLYSRSTSNFVAARQCLANRGVAMNAVAMDDDSRTTSLTRWHYSCRYNHLGEMNQEFKPPVDELSQTTLALMKNKLWPDGATGRIAELRALCVSQHDEWDNQVQYGALYTMMKLLEAQ